MKKFLILTIFVFISNFVFSQRRVAKLNPPSEIISYSIFSKADIKRLQAYKIKKNLYPYLEITIHRDGTRDSTLYACANPRLDIDKMKKGFIPVFIYRY